MTRLHEQITVATPVEEAFAYTADFSNIEEWDPGVEASKRVGNGPVGPGSRFDLRVRFGRKTLPMTYVVTEYDPPSRVTLVGQGDRLTATDTITFEAAAEGTTRITYVADLDFRGWMGWIEPLIGGRLDKVGKDAVGGLRRVLDGAEE
jgi:dehydrogenase/reductase SDR family protein 12